MKKILLLDGFNLIFRAFYGMPDLRRKDGLPTNAIHGWMRSVWYLLDTQQPDLTIACFDLGAPVRQLALRDDYKANRSDTPEDMKTQIPYIKKITAMMGIAVMEQEGIEADDLIGSYCRLAAEQDVYLRFVSADKDLAQCLQYEGISQLLPPPTSNPRVGWRVLESEEDVVDKFGVLPTQIPDYLALVGDMSDNIPGLRGVGPKTAAKWLQQYKNLGEVIANSGMIKPQRFQALIHQERENLELNLEMTRLNFNLPVSFDLDPRLQFEALVKTFEELEMPRSVSEVYKRYRP